MTASLPTLRFAFLVACLGLMIGCDHQATPAPAPDAAENTARANPYPITTTVGMITDIVRQVAGDKATVTGIMKEGVDPHLYKPTRGDVVQLQEADVVFYNGLMLEGKMGDVLVKVARAGKPVYAVTELLGNSDYVMTTEEDHFDPHVWMDPEGWKLAVEAVANALSEHDPANAAAYRANAGAYFEQLEALDAYARRAMASVPDNQRVLVTAHDAFSYLGRAYDMEVQGIQGISTESEAGVKRINDLAKMLSQRKIPAVFVESSVSQKAVLALIEGAKAQGHDVQIGGLLFSDAMGPAGTYEGTYIGMIDHNVTTIARALGGEAPEKGFQGKLTGVAH